LIALGLLMGARDVLDIWRKVACLSQSQRQALGLCVRDKQSGRLTMPGYDALNDLLGAMDPAAYARADRQAGERLGAGHKAHIQTADRRSGAGIV
jgi:hypothetical protein